MNRFKLSVLAAVLLAASLSAGCVAAVEVVPSHDEDERQADLELHIQIDLKERTPNGSAGPEAGGARPGAAPGAPRDVAGAQSIAGDAETCRAPETGAVLARAAYNAGKAVLMHALRKWTVLRFFD